MSDTRIVLDTDDFMALVEGKIVRKEGERHLLGSASVVEIALADIGFDSMIAFIEVQKQTRMAAHVRGLEEKTRG